MYRSEYGTMYHSEEKLWWYLALRNMLGHQLTRYVPKGSRVLDAGCGTGKNMELLTFLGYQAEGFDHSADAVAYCKQRELDQVQQGDITAITYPDATFDAVICMDVVGSLDDAARKQAAHEMLRVLKPGGILICHTASLELFRSQHDDVANIKLRLNRPQIKELFDIGSPQILKLSYRVFFLSPLVLIFKLIKRVTRLFKKEEEESASDQVIFPFGINWMLLQIQLLENKLFQNINFPFGSSVIIVLRKKV